jgi:hypothetical protein
MRAHLGHAAVAALAVAIAAPATAAAAGGTPDEERLWYVPDHAKLQLAGNVGFLSPGLGYAFLRSRLEADAFFGWVPEAIGGTDIVSVTGKLSALPFRTEVGMVSLRPLVLGLQLTYTFGDQYFVRPPSRFPGNYYDFPTALRAGASFGSAAEVLVGGRTVGAYVELVALDVMLRVWADNPRTVGAWDVFSLAIGVRTEI